jgi:hypothetical protein
MASKMDGMLYSLCGTVSAACVCVSVSLQGKADEWQRAWALKPSMAYELFMSLANVMKVSLACRNMCWGLAADCCLSLLGFPWHK